MRRPFSMATGLLSVALYTHTDMLQRPRHSLAPSPMPPMLLHELPWALQCILGAPHTACSYCPSTCAGTVVPAGPSKTA